MREVCLKPIEFLFRWELIEQGQGGGFGNRCCGWPSPQYGVLAIRESSRGY